MDLSTYQEIYVEEVRENIEELQRQLARLEACTLDHAGLEAAYRAAHTLKGDSATMGYDELTTLAYALETPLKRAAQEGHPLPAEFAATLKAALIRLEEALEEMNPP
jgi:two-component system chemotaxis sensor kinase CheA